MWGLENACVVDDHVDLVMGFDKVASHLGHLGKVGHISLNGRNTCAYFGLQRLQLLSVAPVCDDLVALICQSQCSRTAKPVGRAGDEDCFSHSVFLMQMRAKRALPACRVLTQRIWS